MRPIVFIFDYVLLTYSLKFTYIILDIDFHYFPSCLIRLFMCLSFQYINNLE